MGVPTVPEASSLRWGTLLLTIFLAASRGLVAAIKVTTPYSLYVCPEGQNVTLTCRILDSVSKGHDANFLKTWFLSSRGEVQVCKEHRPIRNFISHHQHHRSHPAVNASHDQPQKHGLEIAYDNHGITAAALATGACIVGILCLPLILLLVYKQRQAASHRRAQELVRMDSSNTQGIENPGYETTPPFQGMPEAKTRPPLSYVAQRQPSESGRHLLSDPSTPLSPPGPGDVFFPSLDPVPDSPNSEAI
ncbi:rCG22135, isoform CRA_b [Rattus norvegicus]|uniref:RCG22135, isoform CRA_b n=1 Tax=Rattus norvegicus TaxID=10116 RepID=A6K3X7_RAT|nr:rCG22135, isoform CRA_b [Rattus norvegicus]